MVLSLTGETRKEEVMLATNTYIKRHLASGLAAVLIKYGLNFTVLL